MGLDMFLERRHYVHNWPHMAAAERHTVIVKKGDKPVPASEIDPAKVSHVIEEVGYWRKANAIHQWFVDNVQDGDDDCKEYYVSREQMQELLDIVNKVLAASELIEGKIQNGYTFKDDKKVPIMEDGKYIKDPSVARELLPTQEGFFFGSTGYDQYYVDDLKDTKKILEEALKSPDADYYYSSSW
jgi:hypothetical protein